MIGGLDLGFSTLHPPTIQGFWVVKMMPNWKQVSRFFVSEIWGIVSPFTSKNNLEERLGNHEFQHQCLGISDAVDTSGGDEM